jgi:hypothetical protein
MSPEIKVLQEQLTHFRDPPLGLKSRLRSILYYESVPIKAFSELISQAYDIQYLMLRRSFCVLLLPSIETLCAAALLWTI